MDWNRLPDGATLERTMEALRSRNFMSDYVPTKEAALQKLLELIPAGAEVMHGYSTTLIQVGFVQLLEEGERYRYYTKRVRAEQDPQRRTLLRRQGVLADYFLGSVQAIAETGEVVSADASGSRNGGYVFGAPHVIWVASTNKIVPTLDDALRRTREHALRLEDQRMKDAGGAGSFVGKLVIFEREGIPNRIQIMLIGEVLGF